MSSENERIRGVASRESVERRIETGNVGFNGAWAPFEWNDPKFGFQAKGEVAVIRSHSMSGTQRAGLWRCGSNMPGCETDGSCHFDYSAPMGDETVVILEGTATVTVRATGQKYQIEAGSIVSHPKGLEVSWCIDGPFFKKFWILWDSPTPATKSDHIFIGSINDNPKTWVPYSWDEPGHGPQVFGELFALRATGSTGTMMCGLWRAGVGMPGCKDDGSSAIPYSAFQGDEIMLLLEGTARVVNEENGDEYAFKAGDVIALPQGLNISYISEAPFAKKFWFVSSARLP